MQNCNMRLLQPFGDQLDIFCRSIETTKVYTPDNPQVTLPVYGIRRTVIRKICVCI